MPIEDRDRDGDITIRYEPKRISEEKEGSYTINDNFISFGGEKKYKIHTTKGYATEDEYNKDCKKLSRIIAAYNKIQAENYFFKNPVGRIQNMMPSSFQGSFWDKVKIQFKNPTK